MFKIFMFMFMTFDSLGMGTSLNAGSSYSLANAVNHMLVRETRRGGEGRGDQ